MAVTVDGRTDVEKLAELLSEPEQQHLEFKESVDLSSNEGKVKFVKDVVSMSNRPPGGYILIGVDDTGKLVAPQGTFDQNTRKRFDGARLNDLIRRYTEGPVHVTSQFHIVSSNEIILIYTHHNESGLPVPMSCDGQYSDNNRTNTVFRKGDVCIRDGAHRTFLCDGHIGTNCYGFTISASATMREKTSNLWWQKLPSRCEIQEANLPYLCHLGCRMPRSSKRYLPILSSAETHVSATSYPSSLDSQPTRNAISRRSIRQLSSLFRLCSSTKTTSLI